MVWMRALLRSYLLGGLLFLGGLWLWLGGVSPAIAVQPFRVEVAANQTLVGQAYLPAIALRPVPAVLLCHGVSSHKDTLAPLAQELARHGIAGVVFDFGGAGQSYRRPLSQEGNLADGAAVLQWMRQHPQFDAQRLGIGGHSMGGTTALELAKANPDLKTTVVLSIAGFVTPTSPANLFLGSGVYEEFNAVGDMQALFATGMTGAVPPFTTVGDFTQGTARQLVFSPTTDHAFAPYDAFLHRAVIAWVEQSFGMPAGNLPVRVQREMMGKGLSIGALLGLAIAGYTQLLRWGKRRVVTTIGVALGVVLVLRLDGGSGVALLGWVIFLRGNVRGRKPGNPWQSLLYGSMAGGLGLLAVVFNALLIGSLVAVPRAIWALPTLAVNLLFGLPYHGFHSLRYGLDSALGRGLLTSLVAVELIQPGVVCDRVNAALAGLNGWIHQPLSWRWQSTSWQALGLIPLLLGLLGLILLRQQQSGVLSWEAGRFMVRLVGVFLLLPIFLGVGVVRSRPFRQIENRVKKMKYPEAR